MHYQTVRPVVNWVTIRHLDANDNLMSEQRFTNNRTDMGALWETNLLHGTQVLTGSAVFIALTGSLFTPTGTVTALLGEIATFGFSRVHGTRQNYVAPTAINGTCTVDIYHQFMHTGTGTSVGIGMAALFTLSAVGTLYALATFTQGPATLALGEKLDVTWTVSG